MIRIYHCIPALCCIGARTSPPASGMPLLVEKPPQIKSATGVISKRSAYEWARHVRNQWIDWDEVEERFSKKNVDIIKLVHKGKITEATQKYPDLPPPTKKRRTEGGQNIA